MGLLHYSASDLFPLTIPRWRWGMRILQGKSSLSLGSNPRSRARWEDEDSKLTSTHQDRRTQTTATSVLIMSKSFCFTWCPVSLEALPTGKLHQSFMYLRCIGCLQVINHRQLFQKRNENCLSMLCLLIDRSLIISGNLAKHGTKLSSASCLFLSYLSNDPLQKQCNCYVFSGIKKCEGTKGGYLSCLRMTMLSTVTFRIAESTYFLPAFAYLLVINVPFSAYAFPECPRASLLP